MKKNNIHYITKLFILCGIICLSGCHYFSPLGKKFNLEGPKGYTPTNINNFNNEAFNKGPVYQAISLALYKDTIDNVYYTMNISMDTNCTDYLIQIVSFRSDLLMFKDSSNTTLIVNGKKLEAEYTHQDTEYNKYDSISAIRGRGNNRVIETNKKFDLKEKGYKEYKIHNPKDSAYLISQLESKEQLTIKTKFTKESYLVQAQGFKDRKSEITKTCKK